MTTFFAIFAYIILAVGTACMIAFLSWLFCALWTDNGFDDAFDTNPNDCEHGNLLNECILCSYPPLKKTK